MFPQATLQITINIYSLITMQLNAYRRDGGVNTCEERASYHCIWRLTSTFNLHHSETRTCAHAHMV
ncbi:hypothetical protein HALO59_40369 [Halomonas sp. 59]|nr:hypothetical protein HALO113_70113 [Halomonas sp. 113]CAD5279944.1 hypothetical protein HALO59_40369 [Halomonas sp. 59]CAD5285876.1 hypothetical protein HALOI3_40115 [Halomonas sp. I3]VXB03518.1 hypothetical protein HALO153_100115 [Halomonas titanicae]VXC12155.1 hypothetical protein HALO98_50116 [Halomonas titanicae]